MTISPLREVPRAAGPRMNLLDRAIAVVAPVQAVRRWQARQALASVGGYQGARRDRRALQNFRPLGGSPDADLLPDLPALRERARDLERNDPIAGGAIRSTVTNVVGTGLACRPQVDAVALGLSEDQADAWEENTEREWRLWAESTDCDITRTQKIYGLQDLAFRSALTSGDCFGVLRMKPRPGTVYSLRVQLVEGDRVSTPRGQRDSRNLAAGVALDDDGAPTGYWIADRHPGDRLSFVGAVNHQLVPAFGARSGMRQVLHLFDRTRPDQHRGVPYLAPVIEPLKQLGRYSDAELTAAVVNACFAITTKTQAGPALSPLVTGPNATADGNAGDGLKRVDMAFESGLVIEGLRKDEAIESFAASRPNENFDPFFLAMLRQIGVALELPFEVLVKHFTASYSAARAALLQAWKFYVVRRARLADDFCEPVYRAWLTEAVAIGRVEAPGFFRDPALRAAWSGADWIGDSPGQIDETRETEAAKMRVDMGVSTLDEETMRLTGGDWRRKHRQRVKEAKARRADGLEGAASATPGPSSAGSTRGSPANGAPPNPDAPEEEDES